MDQEEAPVRAGAFLFIASRYALLYLHRMMRVFLSILTVSSAVFGFVTSAHAKTKDLQPSSEWVVNYANDSCQMTRSFGSDKDKVWIKFDQFAPGPQFTLSLIGRTLPLSPSGTAKVKFGPAGEEHEEGFLGGKFEDGRRAVLFTGSSSFRVEDAATEKQPSEDESGKSFGTGGNLSELMSATLSSAKDISYVEIDFVLKDNLRLELGPMVEPVASLGRCTMELLGHWDIDLGKHLTLSRPVAALNVGKWILASDYPKLMASRGLQGEVRFRLDISESGDVKKCHVQATTSPSDFESAVCDNIMRRAKFEPALDAEGQPMKSYYTNSVSFQIRNR